MGLQGYVGNSADAQRIRKQEKQREEEKKKFEERKRQQEANADGAGLRQFGTGVSEVLENAFKNETVGLVTREEFVTKRETLKERFEEEAKRKQREVDALASREREERKRKKAKLASKSKLSFLGDDAAEEDAGPNNDADDDQAHGDGANGSGGNDAHTNRTAGSGGGGGGASQRVKFATLGKDPNARAEFLPDKDREVAEAELREQLQKEWALRQQVIKNEPLQITYSYWDGSGHRRNIKVRKGDTIGQFLAAVRDQLAPEFREMRATSAGSLMYVKEDLILPHNVSFYDLIINKARGKSGPLFHFDVHEDVRMVNDARVEKDESHAGKVCDRGWYNRNRHIFPASRWEVYDPEASYDKYTIHGD